MNEQKYRVIADRDKGEKPVHADAAHGDRLVYEVIDDDHDTLVRIERPVPTTEEPQKPELVTLHLYRDTCVGGLFLSERELDRTLHEHVEALTIRRDQLPSPHLPTREQIAEEEERIRRDERMRWAIYLWNMDEDTDGPEGAFEEGADMAYHAVAAWLLANIARGFSVSDMPWLDPDLIEDAKRSARLLPAHPDSEVHEVERCVAVLALIQNGADR